MSSLLTYQQDRLRKFASQLKGSSHDDSWRTGSSMERALADILRNATRGVGRMQARRGTKPVALFLLHRKTGFLTRLLLYIAGRKGLDVICCVEDKEEFARTTPGLKATIVEYDDWYPSHFTMYSGVVEEALLATLRELMSVQLAPGVEFGKVIKNGLFTEVVSPLFEDLYVGCSLLGETKPDIIVNAAGPRAETLRLVCKSSKARVITFALLWPNTALNLNVIRLAFSYLACMLALVVFSIGDSLFLRSPRSLKEAVVVTSSAHNHRKFADRLRKERDLTVLVMPRVDPRTRYLRSRGNYYLRMNLSDLVPMISLAVRKMPFRTVCELLRSACPVRLSNTGLPVDMMPSLRGHLCTVLPKFMILQAVPAVFSARFLREKNVKACVFPSLSGTSLQTLNCALRTLGVKTLHIQHGMVHSVRGYRTDASVTFAWGEYDAELLKAYGSDDRVVFPCVQEDMVSKKDGTKLKRGTGAVTISIFTNPMLHGDPQGWRRDGRRKYRRRFADLIYAFAVAHMADRKVSIVLKVHPSETGADYARLARLPNVICAHDDAAELIKRSILVITPYSSVIAEALLLGVPFLLYDAPVYDRETFIQRIPNEMIFNTLEVLLEKERAVLSGEYTFLLTRLRSAYFGTRDILSLWQEVVNELCTE